MIAVIFEVEINAGQQGQYLDIATTLRPLLEEIDGFISVERFQSLTTPEKLLSLSYWRDEAAIKAWRELEKHRSAQEKGRAEVFKTYTIRVAEVVRDYGA
ncbi:MAG: antibiotic biosynthesis monooxygenase [Rhodobacteraceae bacterium]|nr:antibiotic biosynthesis monooxygenase [Paracoccaceae bacterium]